MMQILNKKVVWITGGGTGIGAKLAEIFADKNWIVIISGRRINKLKLIKKKNTQSIFIFKNDVASNKNCKNVTKKILDKFGKIDMLILNAAAYNPGHLNFDKIENAKKVLDTNIMGQINCVSNVLPRMKKLGSGSIIFISSPAGFRGLPNSGFYGVSKSALTFLAESLYLELKKENIKIKVVHPGFIKTPMTDKNDFPMPFLMSSSEAAKRIYKNLFNSCFEISFPKRLILPMKILSLLPYKVYFFLMDLILKRATK